MKINNCGHLCIKEHCTNLHETETSECGKKNPETQNRTVTQFQLWKDQVTKV